MHRGERAPSYRALLEIPTLGRIVAGMALSRTANSMLGVAIILFALTRFQSPALAGIVTFAAVAPGLALSPIAGALLDRHGRTRLIVADQLIAAASLVLIATLALTNVLTAPMLVVMAAIAGLTNPLSSVGLRTLFPVIVPRHLWERINAVDSNGYVVATLVGPPAAGLLVQVAGGPQTLLLIAALYGVSALVFTRVREPEITTSSTGRLLVDAWLGLQYTLRNPTLRGLGVTMTLVNLGWGIVTIVLPVLLLETLGYGEAVVGIAFAVSGVTGGVGAILAGRLRVQGRERPMLVWPMFGMAAAAAAMTVSPTLPVVIGVMAVQGFLNGPMDVAMFTLRQRRTDPAWLGRAFAVSMSINFLGYPIGAAIGGTLVGSSVALALGVAVVCTIAAGISGWLLLPRETRPEARLQ
ncbi:MAG: MFS transporter [Candidatus Limnocylindrales bacterium]